MMVSREMAIALGAIGLVVVGGGIAYAASSSSSSAASAPAPSGGGNTAGLSLPAGVPQGLLSSGPTSSGWAQTIEISASQSGIAYPTFLGDRITVELPAGAHWSAPTAGTTTTTVGPRTGSDPWVFTMVEPMAMQVTWTDASNVDRVTILSMTTGGTFARTTHFTTGDYVIIAIASGDLATLVTSLNHWVLTAEGGASDENLQQAATAAAAIAALTSSGGSVTGEFLLTLLIALGPWANAFAPDVKSMGPLPAGTALPAWWPKDDTNAATEGHVIYRYVGPGIDVASLPFPVTAWKRTA